MQIFAYLILFKWIVCMVFKRTWIQPTFEAS